MSGPPPPPAPPAEVRWRSALLKVGQSAGVSWFYAAGVANVVGVDVAIAAILVAAATTAVTHLALLIARRRRGLILHGVNKGFLVPSGALPNDRSPPKSTGVGASIDVVVAGDRGTTWDGSCAMVYEGGQDFVGPIETMSLVAFFTRPVFVQVYAVACMLYTVACAALDAHKVVLGVHMATAIMLKAFVIGPSLRQGAIVDAILQSAGGTPSWIAPIVALVPLASLRSLEQGLLWVANPDCVLDVATNTAAVVACLMIGWAVTSMERRSHWFRRARASFLLLCLVGLGAYFAVLIWYGYVVHVSAAPSSTFESLREHARSAPPVAAKRSWALLFSACTLTFEMQRSVAIVGDGVNAATAGRASSSRRLTAHSGYTFATTRSLILRCAAVFALQFVITTTFVGLVRYAAPGYDGQHVLPTYLAREFMPLVAAPHPPSPQLPLNNATTSNATTTRGIQQFGPNRPLPSSHRLSVLLVVGIAVFPIPFVVTTISGAFFTVPRLASFLLPPASSSPCGALYGQRWVAPARWFGGGLTMALVASIAAASRSRETVLSILFVSGAMIAFGFPLVVWRFSRLELRRLQVPKRLDAALQIPPPIGRVAMVASALCCLASMAFALGIGTSSAAASR